MANPLTNLDPVVSFEKIYCIYFISLTLNCSYVLQRKTKGNILNIT